MVNRAKLTKSVVDAIPLVPDGQALYWDSTLPGFGVRVGSKAKAYVVEGRVNGKTVRFTIGRHGVYTADAARDEANEILVGMRKGIDPNAEKALQKAKSVTLGEVYRDYLANNPKLKPLTLRDYRLVMVGFGDWLTRPITAITKDMISRRHVKLGEASQARANLAMRVLRALFNFAAARYEDKRGRPVIVDNPVKRLSQTRSWYAVGRRTTLIKAHQLAAWYRAVTALPGLHAGPKRDTVRDYLLTLILTGMRRGEAATLKWEDVDLTASTLTVRDTKNGLDHTLPLSDHLLELLKTRKQTAGGVYVFPGEGAGGHLVEPRDQIERVIKESGVQFTLHDLRRTFTTIAESIDIPAYAIKRLLNHKMKGDVTAGYIVMDVERLRPPMQKITDFILSAAGVKPSAEITDLATKRNAAKSA